MAKGKYIILSRGKHLYATKRLYKEFKNRGKDVSIIDPLELVCHIEKDKSQVFYRNEELVPPCFVVTRINQLNYEYILMVIRQLELSGFDVLNSSSGVFNAKDKFRCLQEIAAKGIDVVPSILTQSKDSVNMIKKLLGDPPYIVKATKSMGGYGTVLVENDVSLSSAMQLMWHSWYDSIVQKYLKNIPPVDYRVIVMDSKALCSAKRTGKGDFRTNFHQGGDFKPVKLSKGVEDMAIKASKIVGLKLSAVDLIESHGKFYVLEINSSPGFEGVEKAVSKNIAGEIAKYCIKSFEK